VGKIVTQLGAGSLKKLRKTRKQFREQIYDSLKLGRTYVLDFERRFIPKTEGSRRPMTLLEEYGLR